ncbi:MAG: DUF805 domain-containing protein [Paludibacteraceae bacterium]|nr:DUF805 domain-containing protein [Paludibacteraceae bacterium]
MEWFIKCLKNYANFNGRARRKEYWMFTLFYTLLYLPVYAITMFATSQELLSLALIANLLMMVIALGLLLPALAVQVRRLHDINKSGWWILLGFVPLANFALLYFTLKEGDKGENLYGPDPKSLEGMLS